MSLEERMGRKIVDPHHHFYCSRTNKDLHSIIKPLLLGEEEEEREICYLPEDYERDSSSLQILKSVHVECLPTCGFFSFLSFYFLFFFISFLNFFFPFLFFSFFLSSYPFSFFSSLPPKTQHFSHKQTQNKRNQRNRVGQLTHPTKKSNKSKRNCRLMRPNLPNNVPISLSSLFFFFSSQRNSMDSQF